MRSALIILFMSFASGLISQTTIIHDFEGRRSVEDPAKYELTGSTEHTVIVHHYKLIDQKERNDLIDLIIRSIDFYLDEVMEIAEDRMIVRKTEKEIMKDLKGIVDEHIDRYEYKVDESFNGFSIELEEKIKTIEKLNWAARSSDIEKGTVFDKRQLAMNYVRKQINEFKEITTRDLEIYAKLHIHEATRGSDAYDGPALAFNPPDEAKLNQPLPAYDFPLSPQRVEDIDMYLEPEVNASEIPQGTDDQIVALLKSNNELIKMFGEQMILLQKEMIELKRESNSFHREFSEIRTELAGLRSAIDEINENNSAALNSGKGELVSLSEFILRFNKNSASISSHHRVLLNELVYELIQNDSHKAMITGFADKSGTPELNARISKLRANSVKAYLVAKGISGDRLLINYLGDARSDSENPDDRKVEVKLLN